VLVLFARLTKLLCSATALGLAEQRKEVDLLVLLTFRLLCNVFVHSSISVDHVLILVRNKKTWESIPLCSPDTS